ncbi:hypothetical protein PI95_024295 [Hassallia byssoidea VB512170]|uniref:Uncharacterized protein n=1 Tax=Hassallia byssoidea VB512170 TaxID=1304833 RepID=A0A846HDX1_9CYAN|nr:hypothetical protein [Hassalia byssoidea]NEU75592.1 hypothetical protein [Hassalia byssoidea VB512170]
MDLFQWGYSVPERSLRRLISFGKVNMSLMQLNPTQIQQNQPETQINPHYHMSH